MILCLKFIERPSDWQVKKELFEKLQNEKICAVQRAKNGCMNNQYLCCSRRNVTSIYSPFLYWNHEKQLKSNFLFKMPISTSLLLFFLVCFYISEFFFFASSYFLFLKLFKCTNIKKYIILIYFKTKNILKSNPYHAYHIQLFLPRICMLHSKAADPNILFLSLCFL